MRFTAYDNGPNSPLTFVVGDVTIGQFYDSYSKKYHLAIYVPYVSPPKKYLCSNAYGNFSPSRRTDETRNKCHKCFEILEGSNE